MQIGLLIGANVLAMAVAQAHAPSSVKGDFHYGTGVVEEGPNFEMEITEKVPVPMRDGVALATMLALPKGEGPWPVVLVRTPYGRANDAGNWGMKKIVPRGYAFVSQDMRSTGEPGCAADVGGRGGRRF